MQICKILMYIKIIFSLFCICSHIHALTHTYHNHSHTHTHMYITMWQVEVNSDVNSFIFTVGGGSTHISKIGNKHPFLMNHLIGPWKVQLYCMQYISLRIWTIWFTFLSSDAAKEKKKLNLTNLTIWVFSWIK